MDKNEMYQYAGFNTEEIGELEKERCSLYRKASLFSFDTKMLQFESLVVSCHDSATDLNNEVDQPQCKAHLFLVIDNLPYAISNMQKKNIPEDIIRATFSDISCWYRYHKRECDGCGLSPRIVEWLSNHFEGKLYQLGLLQFEIASLYLEVKGLLIGAPVLKVHIPEGRRLLSDECDQSFQQAESFFKDILPYEFQAYIFDSWLYDQDFLKLLPESSHIRKFVKRFSPVRQNLEKDGEIYQRIFGGRAARTGIVERPFRTSLQKIMYPFFKEKILFGSGVGIILKNPRKYK
jgi:GNAT-like C-terminal domain/N-acyltransferase N-terminal domain